MTIEQPKISANLQQGLSLDEQIKNGWKRYSEGDREGSLGVADSLIRSCGQDCNVTEKMRELHALAAWSCYHLHKYQECLKHCGHSQSHPRALECELTLRSFISDYREEERLQELREAIGDTPAAANAFLIRAISMKDVPHDQVTLVVERFSIARRADVDGDVILGHILNNAAKVLIYSHHRADGEDKLAQAERWLRAAIEQYQRVSASPDHLAAAYYHLSKTSPDLSSKRKWLSQSVRSWKLFNEGKAPQSPSVEKQSQAEKELQELAPSLVEL